MLRNNKLNQTAPWWHFPCRQKPFIFTHPLDVTLRDKTPLRGGPVIELFYARKECLALFRLPWQVQLTFQVLPE